MKLQLKSGEVAIPTATYGQMVNCQIKRDNGIEYRIIGEVDCKNRHEFWTVWRECGGQSMIISDSGEIWDPSEEVLGTQVPVADGDSTAEFSGPGNGDGLSHRIDGLETL